MTVTARFSGRVAVVTGAGAGIGLATARRLHQEGASIIALDRDEDAWTRNAGFAKDGDASVLFVKADVTSENSILQAVNAVVDRFGCIDVLVNNAGGTTAESFAAIDTAVWRSELETNVTSQFLVTRAFLPHFAETGGAIVNLSSINAVMYFGNPAYSAAKAAVVSLTRSQAIEFAPRNIRVNAVLPGSVKTEAWDFRIAQNPDVIEKLSAWYPSGFVAEPDDIAPAICFLAASEARFITGAALVVDGGITAGTPRLVADFLNT